MEILSDRHIKRPVLIGALLAFPILIYASGHVSDWPCWSFVHPLMSLTIASVLDELEFAMRMHMLHVLAVAGTLLVVPVAWAHHSFSMFDPTKISRITDAKVAEFRFTNPHSFVVIEQGGIRYVLECTAST